jgi:hypothetical protein
MVGGGRERPRAPWRCCSPTFGRTNPRPTIPRAANRAEGGHSAGGRRRRSTRLDRRPRARTWLMVGSTPDNSAPARAALFDERWPVVLRIRWRRLAQSCVAPPARGVTGAPLGRVGSMGPHGVVNRDVGHRDAHKLDVQERARSRRRVPVERPAFEARAHGLACGCHANSIYVDLSAWPVRDALLLRRLAFCVRYSPIPAPGATATNWQPRSTYARARCIPSSSGSRIANCWRRVGRLTRLPVAPRGTCTA